jgi:hypothetical protein
MSDVIGEPTGRQFPHGRPNEPSTVYIPFSAYRGIDPNGYAFLEASA